MNIYLLVVHSRNYRVSSIRHPLLSLFLLLLSLDRSAQKGEPYDHLQPLTSSAAAMASPPAGLYGNEKSEKSGEGTLQHNLVELKGNADQLQRHLGNRQIQLIAVGGTIGTALFVSIGGGLMQGGPGSLFIAFTLYSILMGLVNNCIAEMAIYMPVSGSFIRMAGK